MTIMDGTGWRATSVRTDPVGVAVRVMTATVGRARAGGTPGQQAGRRGGWPHPERGCHHHFRVNPTRHTSVCLLKTDVPLPRRSPCTAVLVLPVALLAAALAACSAPEPSGASGAAPATQLAEPDHTVLSANSTAKLGTVVIDGLGWTLYRFDADSATPSRSACTGSCADQWPPVLMQAGTPAYDGRRPRGRRHGRPRRRPPAGDDRRVAGVPARERLPAGLRRRTGRAGPVVRRHPDRREGQPAGLTAA